MVFWSLMRVHEQDISPENHSKVQASKARWHCLNDTSHFSKWGKIILYSCCFTVFPTSCLHFKMYYLVLQWLTGEGKLKHQHLFFSPSCNIHMHVWLQVEMHEGLMWKQSQYQTRSKIRHSLTYSPKHGHGWVEGHKQTFTQETRVCLLFRTKGHKTFPETNFVLRHNQISSLFCA